MTQNLTIGKKFQQRKFEKSKLVFIFISKFCSGFKIIFKNYLKRFYSTFVNVRFNGCCHPFVTNMTLSMSITKVSIQKYFVSFKDKKYIVNVKHKNDNVQA